MTLEGVTGLVLAGGQGSRMDGADKGLMLYGGMPLVLHALLKLQPFFSNNLLVSANRNRSVYAGFGVTVIEDGRAGFEGPLAGIAAALAQVETSYLLTVPCDVPLFPAQLPMRLMQALIAENADIAVASAASEPQYAFLLMKTDLRASLRTYLDNGRRSIQGWLEAVAQSGGRVATVVMDDLADVTSQGAHAFTNLNTLQELDALESARGIQED